MGIQDLRGGVTRESIRHWLLSTAAAEATAMVLSALEGRPPYP